MVPVKRPRPNIYKGTVTTAHRGRYQLTPWLRVAAGGPGSAESSWSRIPSLPHPSACRGLAARHRALSAHFPTCPADTNDPRRH